MKVLASWCVRHRLIVLLLWLAALVGTSVSPLRWVRPTRTASPCPTPSRPERSPCCRRRRRAWPATVSRSSSTPPNGAKVTDPAVKAAVTTMLDKVGQVPHVSSITSPYEPKGAAQVSANGTTGFATVTFDQLSQYISTPLAKQFVAAAQTGIRPNLQVAVAGQVAEAANKVSFGGTLPGVILAGVVLLLVFGSVFAMALPLVSALASLGTAIGLIGLLSHLLKMPQFSPTPGGAHRARGRGRLRPVHRDPTSTRSDRRK